MRSLALVWLLALTACGTELAAHDALYNPAEGAGSLKLPLVGVDATGRSYRLRHGTFELNGAGMMTLAVDPGAEVRKSMITPLPSGEYQAFLREGFQLVEVAEDGSELPIEAVLVSPNPARFDVEPRSDQELRLTFRRGDLRIALGGSGVERIARRATERGALASASPGGSQEPTSP